MNEDDKKYCSCCLFYTPTCLSGECGECSITDNAVDYNQSSCMDFIEEEPGIEGKME